jgi:hypothetical protein
MPGFTNVQLTEVFLSATLRTVIPRMVWKQFSSQGIVV